MTPGLRIIHPEFGDCTADIIEALMEDAKLAHPVILEREAALMAAASGQVARDLTCGRVVAEFPEQVVADWEAREGRQFFTKAGDGVKYLTKHFPQCRVDSRGRQAGTRADMLAAADRRAKAANAARAAERPRIVGKRGRWAA